MTQTMFYNFNNGASGTLLQNYSPGSGETSASWVLHAATSAFSRQNFMITSSGSVRLADGSSTGTVNAYIPNLTTTYDDVEVSAKIIPTVLGGFGVMWGVGARFSSTGTGAPGGYLLRYRHTYGIQLFKYILNGSSSQIGSTVAITPSDNTFYTATINVSGTSTVVISGFLQRNSDGYWLGSGGTFQSTKVPCIVYQDSAVDRITGGSSYRYPLLMLGYGASNTTGWQATEFTVLEDAPSLSAGALSSISAGFSSLTATWAGASGGTAPYTSQLQRSLVGVGSWTDITGATSSPYTDTTVTQLVGYDYRVKFVDQVSGVAYSNTSSGSTTTAPDFHLYYNGSEVTSGSVISIGNMAQNSSQSFTFVIANSGSASLNVNQVVIGSDFSFVTDPSFTATTAHSTRVMSVSLNTATPKYVQSYFSIPTDNSVTPLSFLVTGNILSSTVPGAPTGLSEGTVTTSSAGLLWGLPDSADLGVLVERSPNGSSSWTVLTTGSAHSTSYTDSTVDDNTTYYYRVRSYNAVGFSDYSDILSITTPLEGAPAPPTNLVISIQSDTDLNVMWDTSDNNENYFELQRSLDQSDWKTLPVIGKGENTFNDYCVYPATTYYYRIRGVSNVGAGGWSAVASKTTPASRAGLIDLSSIVVSNVNPWTNTFIVNGVGGNRLFMERSYDGVWFKPIYTLGNKSNSPFYDFNLTAGSTVYYRARVLNSGGSFSDWLVTTGTTLPTPAYGTPNQPGNICINTYNLILTGTTSGTFKLKVSTVDEFRQPVELVSPSINYNVTASELQATLRSFVIYPKNSLSHVAGSNGNYQIGFEDLFTSLSIYSDSTVGTDPVVNENQTGTNTTLVFASNNNSGTLFSVETSPITYGYYDFTEVGSATSTNSPAVSYNLTTTPERAVFVRARAVVGSLTGDYSGVAHLISPTSGYAYTYSVGPGKDFENLAFINWTLVGPGSTITIYPNLSGSTIIPWDSLLMISTRGTVSKPIIVQGVITSGTPTIISGRNGKIYDELGNSQFRPYWLGSGAGDPGFQGNCITVCRRNTQATSYSPGHIIIRNFQLTEASYDVSTFTGYSTAGVYPTKLSYSPASCGVNIALGQNIRVSNNIINANGNGIFAAGGQDQAYPATETRHISNLTIEFNKIYGNGHSNNFTQHNSYIEALDTYYIGNEYGQLYPGSQGVHGLKDRGPGTVVAYNDFRPGTNYACDFVECQNLAGQSLVLDRYRYTIFIGNNSYITSGSGYHIHYGSDGGYPNTTGRKGILYMHNNTLVKEDFAYRFYVVRNNDNNVLWPCHIADIRNNIMMYNYVSGGQGLNSVSGISYLGTNWITVNYKLASDQGPVTYIGGTGNLIVGDGNNNPGFTDRINNNFELTSGSVCINRASARVPSFVQSNWPLKYQYAGNRTLEYRPPASGVYDLGANEYFTTYLTSSTLSLEKGAQNVTIGLTGNGTTFSGTPFYARDTVGNLIAIDSQTVTNGTVASIVIDVPDYITSLRIIDSISSASINIPVVDTTPPTVSSAVIDTSGSKLTLTFSEPVVNVMPEDYQINSLLSRSLSASSGQLTSWMFEIDPIAYKGQTYTFNYIGNRTQDDSGYLLGSIASGTVTNNSLHSVTGISITALSGNTLPPETSVQLNATVLGAGSPPSGRVWSLYAGVGTINSNGVYTSPSGIFSAQTGTVQVTTADGQKYDRLTLTTSALPYVITGVTITPNSANLLGEETQLFRAVPRGTGTMPTGITWSIQSGQGTVSASGLFTAPGAGQSTKTTVLKATSINGWATQTAVITTPPAASGGGGGGDINIYIGIDRGKVR